MVVCACQPQWLDGSCLETESSAGLECHKQSTRFLDDGR